MPVLFKFRTFFLYSFIAHNVRPCGKSLYYLCNMYYFRKLIGLLLTVFACHCLAQTPYWQLEKLAPSINSAFDEITPVPSRDGKLLFFTRVGFPDFDQTLYIDSVEYSKKETATEFRKTLQYVFSKISGKTVFEPAGSAFNQDIWFSRISADTQFREIFHPGYPLNSALPNSVATITPDPNVFYVLNQFSKNGDMSRGFSSVRRQNDSLWDFPVPVEIADYYTITSDVNLTMSFDGQVLILSAVRYDSRDMDLYACFREGINQWSKPLHLGNSINSAYRETTPFLSEDHTTLYFSSNRKGSMGGNDIYSSQRLDDSWMRWTEPIKVDTPVNSASDDGQPYFNMTTGYLYFTSKRNGNSDIYRVRIAPPQATEMMIVGRVIDRSSNQIVPNAKILYTPRNGTKTALTGSIPADDGNFQIMIPKGVPFEFVAEKPGYIGEVDTMIFRRDYYYFREHYLDLYVDKIKENTTIDLKDIYFAQSKAIMLDASRPEMERLNRLLTENPSMVIRIEGHTDNRGSEYELQKLSEERAKAVKIMLLQNGIAAERIEIQGFGSSKSLNDNSDESLRKLNRRVVVRILKI
jgi:outer membrane protein OmpA-like peptidoglycan-associated protein